MEDTAKIMEELEKDPELFHFCNQMRAIEDFKTAVKEETNPAFITDGFETVLKAQENLYTQILTWHSNKNADQLNRVVETCRQSQSQCQMLAKKLLESQRAYDHMHDDLCLCMITEPRYTFEQVILRRVERKKKAESGDGWSNWHWSLRFPLVARLRMAWKIVFGRKDLKTINQSRGI